MPAGMTRRALIGGTAAFGVAMPLGLPLTGLANTASARQSLPIPAEITKDPTGTIRLNVRTGQTRFGNRPMTPTYGINGPYLGPAVRVQRGEKVLMHVQNNLPVPTTMHWHGLIVPGDVDGGPHQVIAPGETWQAPLSIDQPAATLWFHPHIYPSTAELVAKGIAGLLIVEDEESGSLGLPSQWGVDDIPLIIQDRRFDADGAIFHKFNLAAVTVGYVGESMLVNGAEYPVAKTARGWLRLRILNGSNARSYRLAASDKRQMFVIGSDGGLLEQPVSVSELLVHAGERYEVVVDARSGHPFDLITLPVDQPIMRLPPFDHSLPLITFDPSGVDGKGILPEALSKLPDLPVTPPRLSHTLTMDMFRDKEGMALLKNAGLMKLTNGSTEQSIVNDLTDLIVNGPALTAQQQLSSNGVNGSSFSLDAASFPVKRDQLQRWRIDENSDAMLHPVHIHGCQFRVLSINDEQPPEHLAGWKDTVAIVDGGSAEILVRFPHEASSSAPYMAHCHILEHEDSGMMTQFSVV